MELRAWPVLKPHRSDINCLSPPNGWRSGENKDDSGYKSFFEEAEHEMKQDAVRSHVRWIRRREEKVNWM
jgi:hypothetical protein